MDSNMTEHNTRDDGYQEWWLNGKTHREDGPAIILPDGTHIWYQNGELHREDGPAIILPSGIQWWYLNGKRTELLKKKPLNKFTINTKFNIKDGF